MYKKNYMYICREFDNVIVMKKTVLISFLIMLCVASFAQNWYPAGATWTFDLQYLVSYPAHGYVKYSVGNDTVINDTVAKLININTVAYNGNESVANPLIVHESNSRVYHWTGERFKLMYDFNLNAGDTLKTEILYADFCDSVSPVIIDSVSSVNINGINLKVQYITYTPYNWEYFVDARTERIVERVGSEIEFIYEPYCGFGEHFEYTGLRCYNDNDISYRNEWWDYFFHDVECDSVINANIQEVPNDIFAIYPNPSSGKFNISTEGNEGRADIYDSLGRKVTSIESLGDGDEIDLSGYGKGVFLVVVDIDGQLVEKKVVVE